MAAMQFIYIQIHVCIRRAGEDLHTQVYAFRAGEGLILALSTICSNMLHTNKYMHRQAGDGIYSSQALHQALAQILHTNMCVIRIYRQ